MNSTRDQLLAGTGFSQDQHGGIGWPHALNFGEYEFQRRATAHDLVELAVSFVLLTTPKSRDSAHKYLPPDLCQQWRSALNYSGPLEQTQGELRSQKA
jgi:hypothetical protein